MLATTRATAFALRHPYKGLGEHQAWVMGYFGVEPFADRSLPRPAPDTLHPVAFMVEEEPGATLNAHFHEADQFQLFVTGDGRLGRYPIAPFAVHYADAFTPYGPIHAGPEGLSYLTLRNAWDNGPQYMPQSAAALKASRGPGQQTPLVRFPGVDSPLQAGEAAVTEVIAPTERGLAAWLRRARAGERWQASPPAGGGQVWVVARGELKAADHSFDALSCLFMGPSEVGPDMVAGPDGADVIVLQFPERTKA
jgi:hypothetical protein